MTPPASIDGVEDGQKLTSPKIKGGEKGNYLLSFDPGADDSFFEVQNRGSS